MCQTESDGLHVFLLSGYDTGVLESVPVGFEVDVAESLTLHPASGFAMYLRRDCCILTGSIVKLQAVGSTGRQGLRQTDEELGIEMVIRIVGRLHDNAPGIAVSCFINDGCCGHHATGFAREIAGGLSSLHAAVDNDVCPVNLCLYQLYLRQLEVAARNYQLVAIQKPCHVCRYHYIGTRFGMY